jgi:hypothetical protein
MKLLIFICLLLAPTTLAAVRKCYGCSDHAPMFGIPTCASGTLYKTDCDTSDQSCVSVTQTDGKTDKGCLVDENTDQPYHLPDGCGFKLNAFVKSVF